MPSFLLAAVSFGAEMSPSMPSLSSTAPEVAAAAPDKSMPDRLVIEEPTFLCLGVEWFIKGDANRNATVEFHYRRAGATDAGVALQNKARSRAFSVPSW